MGTFEGSFNSWKSACGCDSDSIVSSFTGALLNSDGSPQAGSPVIGAGVNLTTLAVNELSSLQNDTTKGDTRSPLVRPTSGKWDIGAYQYGGGNPPVPPTGLAAVVK